MHEAERGLFDLQRGRPLYVSTGSDADRSGGGQEAVVLATVDGLRPETLEQLRRLGAIDRVRLAVTEHRAQVMGLTNGGPVRPLSLGLRSESTPEQILRLSSATSSSAVDLADVREATSAESAGLTLARLGQLLPAIVTLRVDPAAPPDALTSLLRERVVLTATTAQIETMANDVRVEVVYVSDGPVPLVDAEEARFVVFREAHGIRDHVAILIGDRDQWPDPVPVRIHSACLTGDLFNSLRCDCGEQLRGSLRFFSQSGGGVLLYLAQEGRGIGLGNKLRAYTLQQEGLDTVDADRALGFGADERQYDVAVAMLRQLDVNRIQLLTNNPDKVRAVREGGILVLDRQPLYGTLNRHNRPYVTAKVHRAGHWLAEMLAGAPPVK